MELFQKEFDHAGRLVKAHPTHFQVRSHSIGNCGHEHRTRKAAEPCLRRMKAEWTHWRSMLARESNINHRAAEDENEWYKELTARFCKYHG